MRKPYALLLDLLLLVLFAVIARGAHAEGMDVAGIAQTAWPFLAGCALGWALVETLLRRLPLWQSGVVIWVDTLIIGMLLRMVSGHGAHWSFLPVGSAVLFVLLLGWRLVWWLARGRRLEAERRERRRRRAADVCAEPAEGTASVDSVV